MAQEPKALLFETNWQYVNVLLPLHLPNVLTYAYPSEYEIKVGARVIVPLGKHKYYTGIVTSIKVVKPEGISPKIITDIIDQNPFISQHQLNFWFWMAEYYMCYPGNILQAALPAGFKVSSDTIVQLNDGLAPDKMQSLNEVSKSIVDLLINVPSRSVEEIGKTLQIKNIYAIIFKLIELDILTIADLVRQKTPIRKKKYIKLSEIYNNNDSLKIILDELERKAQLQADALVGLISVNPENEWIEKQLLILKINQKKTGLDALIKKGIIEEVETIALPYSEKSNLDLTLSPAQNVALSEIKKAFKQKSTVLFQGITGSGKTEIYFSIINRILEQKQQVLLMVPEIALTYQLINRLKQQFGEKVALYHSKVGESERNTSWLNASNGVSQVYVGARSSVFLPFTQLGLIIIDEEHDQSFKQNEPSPYYNARDCALKLAQLNNVKVLLGSATPSIESYYYASSNKYGWVKLNERYGGAIVPKIEIIDLSNRGKGQYGTQMFSEKLLLSLAENMAIKQQSILFQNRRGYAPVTQCKSCGWMPECVQCDIKLTYHKFSKVLKCHYCGYSRQVPMRCEQCGSDQIAVKGYGTQRVEEDLQALLPSAQIRRMDLDTTRSSKAYENILQSVEIGQTDILVGTQMVTKGLDFSNVTLVGILQADSSLSYPDFRTFERAFQQLYQVAGRAGRRQTEGKVLIQTYQPTHPVIQWVLQNDYESMAQYELKQRQLFDYPPFVRLIIIQFRDKNKESVEQTANAFTKQLIATFGNTVLGPSEPLVAKIKNQYRLETMFKIQTSKLSLTLVKSYLRNLLETYNRHITFKSTQIFINVDPY